MKRPGWMGLTAKAVVGGVVLLGGWALLVLLAFSWAGASLGAQELEKQQAPAPTEAKPGAIGLAWSGEAPELLRAWCEQKRRDGEAALGQAVVLALAEVVTDFEVSHDVRMIERRLTDLHLVAASALEFEGQREALVQVALARTKFYGSIGQTAKAQMASAVVLPLATAGQTGENHLIDPPRRFVGLVFQATSDKRLIEARAALAGGQDPAGATPDETLDGLVRDALDREDWKYLLEIGSRAAPYVAQALLDAPEDFPEHYQVDPLYYLVLLGEQQAARLIRENIGAGDYLWKKRIIRAMTRASVLDNRGTWTTPTENGESVVCLEPEWLQVLEVLLASPTTALDCMYLVSQVLDRDNLTPAMQESLSRGLNGAQTDYANAVVQLLGVQGVSPSMKPILESAVAHRSAYIRKFAARKLVNYPRSDALGALAGDSDPEIRSLVALSLHDHYGNYRYVSTDGHTYVDRDHYDSPVGEREVAVLKLLVRDEDPSVRREAISGFRKVADQLGEEEILRLLDDEDPDVRSAVASLRIADSELRSRVLTRLVSDPASSVRRHVENVLGSATYKSSLTPYLSALEARLERDVPTSLGSSSFHEIVRKLLDNDEGLRTFVGWALDREDDALFLHVQNEIRHTRGDRPYRHGPPEAFLLLDDPDLARFFARSHRLGGNRFYDMGSIVELGRRRGAMRLLLASEGFDVGAKLAAAVIAAPDGGEVYRKALLQLLQEPEWRERTAANAELDTLTEIAQRLPDSERNTFLLSVVRTPAIPDVLCAHLLYEYDQAQSSGREITLEILARWFTEDGPTFGPVNTALRHLRTLPADIDSSLVRSAVRNPDYAYAAIETMAALKDSAYLSTLGSCLEAEWILESNLRSTVRHNAARALTSYLSDEAASQLMKGLASTDSTLWNICTKGLDQIEEYQNRVRAWNERGSKRATRESAVAELVVMLDDEDPTIRSAAARGLGTLGAVEYMPRLIGMLKDENPKVRDGARDALDRLHEHEAVSKKGTGDG